MTVCLLATAEATPVSHHHDCTMCAEQGHQMALGKRPGGHNPTRSAIDNLGELVVGEAASLGRSTPSACLCQTVSSENIHARNIIQTE